jgi:general secretion pathway protein A
MYTTTFDLKENPFNLTPDPRYLFMSPQHREALSHLIYGISERKGFIVVAGGIGTGKTTICRFLLSILDESVDSALIFNPFMSDLDLLATINHEFGIKSGPGRKSKKRCLNELNTFLLKNYAAGRNAVLLIDEAQNLSLGTMEQIRMLSNLETEKEKLLQIVLLGQPELSEVLRSASLKQLNERIMVRYELKPLGKEHIQQYIHHRLEMAGGNNGNVTFSRGVYKMIFDYSEGIPRRINGICDRALLIAYTKDISCMDKKTIKQAVDDIGYHYATRYRVSSRTTKGPLFLMVSLLILLITLFVTTGMGETLFRIISNLPLVQWIK